MQLRSYLFRFEQLPTIKRWTVLLATVVMVFFITFFLLLYPSIKMYRQTDTAMATIEKQTQQESKFLKKNQFAIYSNQLVGSAQAMNVLKNLIQHTYGLKLIRVKKLSPKKMSIFYKQPIELVFTGDYLNTLRYLQLLSQANMYIIWDKIDFQIIDYPNALITLRISTLSQNKEWMKTDASAL